MLKGGQEQGTVVREQKKEIYNGQMGDKRFGDDGGAKVQHQSRGGQIPQ